MQLICLAEVLISKADIACKAIAYPLLGSKEAQFLDELILGLLNENLILVLDRCGLGTQHN